MTGNEKAPEKAAHPKLRSNLNYHRQNDAHHVLESDLEEQPLMVEEIDGFLSGAGPSGDPFEGYYENTRVQWEYQHDRRGGHMLFVENEDTGELVLTDLNGNIFLTVLSSMSTMMLILTFVVSCLLGAIQVMGRRGEVEVSRTMITRTHRCWEVSKVITLPLFPPGQMSAAWKSLASWKSFS